MSWEANTWAVKQRMKLPQEQLVLIVLGNCADTDAVAFSTWPGRDHWWKYLADVTRLSRSSLFRHINTIVALGLAKRSMIVLADGSKRPTITLNLSATFDIDHDEVVYLNVTQPRQRDESHGETPDDDGGESVGNSSDNNEVHDEITVTRDESHSETGPTSGTETKAVNPTSGNDSVPPAGLHKDSKSCSKEDSPPTPSGGSERDDLWDEFTKAWMHAIPKYALAQTAWHHTETALRPKAIAAAKGYYAHQRAQAKPPSVISAQSFLRDVAGWDQWLRFVPEGEAQGIPASGALHRDSVEARAVIVLHDLAGRGSAVRSYMRGPDGSIRFLKPVTEQLLALQRAEAADRWPTLNRAQAAAWEEFLRQFFDPAVNRKHPKEGDHAPWLWPPKKDGTIYTDDEAPTSEDNAA